MKVSIVTIFILLLNSSFVLAQYNIFGGFDYGFLKLKTTNNIIQEFNERENHNLNDIIALKGYRFGVGRYADFSTVELGFGSVFNRTISDNPALMRETAEIAVNMTSLDASLAWRPLTYRFHAIGAALHLGQIRYRYSFGGDYLVPIKYYSIWGEVYIDLGIPFRFLIKKAARDKLFYIFRIRPYYKFSSPLNISNFQKEFNQDPNIQIGELVEQLNHFGIRISVSIPFLNKEEQQLYKRGGTVDLKRRRKKEKLSNKKSRAMPRERL